MWSGKKIFFRRIPLRLAALNTFESHCILVLDQRGLYKCMLLLLLVLLSARLLAVIIVLVSCTLPSPFVWLNPRRIRQPLFLSLLSGLLFSSKICKQRHAILLKLNSRWAFKTVYQEEKKIMIYSRWQII